MANEAVLRLSIDSRAATRGINQFNQSLNNVQNNTNNAIRSTNNLSKALTGVGTVLGATAVAGTALAASLGKGFLDSASDFEEVQGKFSVVFKGLETEAEGFVTTLKKSFGLSGLEARKALSDFQDFLVPFGFLREDAAKLSNEFVKLGVDVGSFNNKLNPEVINDFKSVLAGSTEVFTKYGGVINQTTIEQEAMTLGLIKTKSQLSPTTKALASLSLMLKNSKDAIGDFARTTKSYANQQKILKANLENLSVTLGQKILPLATQFITTLNKLFEDEQSLNTVIVGTIEVTRTLVNILGVGAVAVTGLGTAFSSIAEEIVTTYTEAVNYVGKALDSLGLLSKQAKEDLKTLNKFKDSVKSNAEANKKALTGVLDKISDVNKGFDSAIKKVNETGQAAIKAGEKAENANNKVVESSKKIGESLKTNTEDYNKLGKSAEKVTEGLVNQSNAVDKINESWKKSADTYGKIQEDWVQLGDKFVNDLEYIPSKLDEMNDKAGHSVTVFEKLGNTQTVIYENTNKLISDNNKKLTDNVSKVNELGSGYSTLKDIIAKSFTNKPVTDLEKRLISLNKEVAVSQGGIEKFSNTMGELAKKEQILAVLQGRMANLKKELDKLDPATEKWVKKKTEVNKLKVEIDNVSKSVEKAKKETEKLEKVFKGTFTKSLLADIKKLNESITDTGKASKEVASKISNLGDEQTKLALAERAVDSLKESLSELAIGSEKYRKTQQKLNEAEIVYDKIKVSVDAAKESVKALAEIQSIPGFEKINADVDKMTKSLLNSKESVKEFNKSWKELNKAESVVKIIENRITVLNNELKQAGISATEFGNKSKEIIKLESALEKARQKAAQTREELNKAFEIKVSPVVKELTKDIDKMKEAVIGAGKGSKELSNNLDKLGTAQLKVHLIEQQMKAIEKSLEGVVEGSAELNKKIKELNKLRQVYKDAQQDVKNLNEEIAASKDAIDPGLAVQFDREFGKVRSGLNKAAGGVSKFKKSVNDAVKKSLKLEYITQKIEAIKRSMSGLTAGTAELNAKQAKVEEWKRIYDEVANSVDNLNSKTGKKEVKTFGGQLTPEQLEEFKKTGKLPAGFNLLGTEGSISKGTKISTLDQYQKSMGRSAFPSSSINTDLQPRISTTPATTRNIGEIEQPKEPVSPFELKKPVDSGRQVNINNYFPSQLSGYDISNITTEQERQALRR